MMRRIARELALQILFQTEFAPPLDIKVFVNHFAPETEADSVEYAKLLIDGVNANKEPIDSLIQKCSQHWKIERMSTVDRNVLRIATFEMKFLSNPLKEKIAINEAIEVAKKYGSPDSPSFVNGILDQVGRQA